MVASILRKYPFYEVFSAHQDEIVAAVGGAIAKSAEMMGEDAAHLFSIKSREGISESLRRAA
jgi:hypothetical protein